MKKCKTMSMGGVLIATALIIPLVGAQQEKVADQDLLNMMAAADAKSTEKPLEKVPEVVVVEEPLEEVNAVVEEAVPAVEEVVPVVAEVVEEVVLAAEVEEELVSPVEEVDLVMDLGEPILGEESPVVDDLGMDSVEGATASIAGNLVSVRLTRVGLEEAINLFAQLSGANIIVPQLTEAAEISVNLKDVEWRPALQSILDTYSYELYQRVSGSSVFSVRRRPPGAPEPQVVETFILKYATVPNAAALVRELLPVDAKVAEFASRNMMVVKTTESALGEVRAVLATIDTVRQQVYIESKFMELKSGNQLDLGLDWAKLGTGDDGKGGLGSSISASTQSYADGRQVSEKDTPLPTDILPVGNFTEHVFTSVLDVDQFRVVLNALETTGVGNMISNPKLIVANEERASISIITKEPNLRQSRQSSANENADTVTYELDPKREFFEYGITLDVTPSINTASNITVKIIPSLTRKDGEKLAGGEKDSVKLTYPFIVEKRVETVFNLADGQTAAIGGLTEVSDREQERHVPMLGSIPYLGRLFSWSQTISEQTETIIFVTTGLADTKNMDLDSTLPSDSELARRQIIKDSRKLKLRKQGRKYYEVQEDDKMEDSLESMKQAEAARIGRRQK